MSKLIAVAVWFTIMASAICALEFLTGLPGVIVGIH